MVAYNGFYFTFTECMVTIRPDFWLNKNCKMNTNLMLDLEGMSWSHEEDRWKWGLEESGMFSVKSTYGKLEGMVLREDLWSVTEKRVFSKIWKSLAPSRVVAFSWKLLYDRIPTKVNLAVRNVLPLEASRLCALCERVDESLLISFFIVI